MIEGQGEVAPLSSMLPFLAVFLTALAVSALGTPIIGRLTSRAGIVAEPGGRRRHTGKIPKLGGLSLLLGYLVAIGLAYRLMPPTGDDALRLRGVILGTLVMVLGGLIDDRWELPALPQFLIQIAGAAVAIAHTVFIEVFTNPVSLEPVYFSWPITLLVTLLWLLGMINAVNWLDGLDGLATGVGTIAALLFAWHSYRLGQTTVALFPLALAGALLGFLPFNFSPARVFLGTAGAYFLGYNLATLSILSPAKIATALLVLALPILDGIWIVISRLRQGHSPFHGDRSHLHFRLSDRGLPTRLIVLGYYTAAIAFGLVAILATGPLVKFVLLVGLGAAVMAFLFWLNRQPG
jgi:UDP-GlcNAc:undecaprenyl-phosphate/decaprenyl-phosphate GlcNAc-1-phosphate transferase